MPSATLSCIAVMPVEPVNDADENTPQKAPDTLTMGSQVLTKLVKQELAGQKQFRFVAKQDVPTTLSVLEKSQKVAAKYQCNTVLDMTLSRFDERIGGEYGVQKPAAVTFAYRLYQPADGKMICHGRFDEQQQSLMENLLNLPEVQRRGLVWLTAEQLAKSGLHERFGECPYLRNGATSKP